MKLICQWCGEEFEASRRDTKYCSRSCGAKASRDRKAKGINSLEHICKKCGKTFIVKDHAFTRRYCYECIPEEIKITSSTNRQIIKRWALEYKGNKCSICGYDKCSQALDFHHLDSNLKDFNLSDRDLILDWKILKKELDKCILVCANCHRELHAQEGDDS